MPDNVDKPTTDAPPSQKGDGELVRPENDDEEDKRFRERMREIKKRDPNVYPTF